LRKVPFFNNLQRWYHWI